MKILFVCKGNVGRSQIAAAFYNKLSNSKDASSAGTEVKNNEGQKIKENEKAQLVIKVMEDEDIDLSNCTRRQLNEDIVRTSDKILIMVKRKETPKYLVNNTKVIFWDIEDPCDRSYEFHKYVKNKIKKLIETAPIS